MLLAAHRLYDTPELMMMRTACALLACIVAACDPGGDASQVTPDSTSAVRDSAAFGTTPGGADSIPPREAHHFDAGTLAVGDTLLGLRVASTNVSRVFEDSIWSGSVAFKGEIELTGVYQPHFDHPEVNELCFHVTDHASQRRIPQFAPDAWSSPNMKSWFCFTNEADVKRLLGTGDPPRDATIVVDDYVKVRIFSDAWDTARLVRVITLGGNASRTLRE